MATGTPLLCEDDADQVIPATTRKVFVAVDDQGQRIGETHANAKLTDAQVDAIRELRETLGLDYAEIATRFNTPKITIAKICTYERRASTIARWKVLLLHTPISLTNKEK